MYEKFTEYLVDVWPLFDICLNELELILYSSQLGNDWVSGSDFSTSDACCWNTKFFTFFKINCILDETRKRNLHAANLRDFQYIRLHSEEFLLLANVDLNWSYLCNVLTIQMPHSPILFNEEKIKKKQKKKN